MLGSMARSLLKHPDLWSKPSELRRRKSEDVDRNADKHIHTDTTIQRPLPSIKSDVPANKRDVKTLSLLLLLLTFVSAIWISLRSEYIQNGTSQITKSRRSFFFIQMADPQFGVINGYSDNAELAMDWTKEKELFDLALTNAARLEPKFLLLSGDMQQFYPKNEGKKNGVLFDAPSTGMDQASDILVSISDILPSSIPVKFLPGNHDIDDDPNLATLEYYQSIWGDSYYSFWQDEVFFIVLNSQFYYDDSSLTDSSIKSKQTEWFQSQLESIQEDTKVPKNVVVLTHIAPFGGSPDEGHGWGNWKLDDRSKILEMATSFDYWPTLWLCGHFHGNGRYYGAIKANDDNTKSSQKSIEVVISNSVTFPMEWGGVPANETFGSSQISAVMSIMDSGDVFSEYIVPDFSRISGGRSKAGLRIVEFFEDGSYRHKWFSLEEIGEVDAVDDETMIGSIENAASWNTSKNKSKMKGKSKNKK
mmetsp:Transcript_6695/g.10199  ORF Transcript_6695/g.10199 Transcript_6695/m.10199 type:complete len:475 (+) Transcript_6695:90-1514(+)